MEYIQSLLDSSSMPMFTAFLLGILMSISPCPLATNITAIGYISKNIDNRHQVFINGLFYTLGRIITYTALGFILIPIIREGSSMYTIQKMISKYGDMLISPTLIVIGIFMLDVIKIKIPTLNIGCGKNIENRGRGGFGACLLGILLALAFCPTSGVFYFGMLIPMSAAENGGYILPVVFAIATSLPVILVAWILAYSVSSMGRFYDNIKKIELWFRRIVAILFILVGVYYGLMFYF